MRLLLIRHWSGTDIASILEVTAARGIDIEVCTPSDGENLPATKGFEGIICMGGPQSAIGNVEGYLQAEMEYLRDAVRKHQPVLGICLGSQLLARALGGAATLGVHGLEAGYIDVLPAASVSEPPNMAGRYFSFHTDSFELPPGAKLLAVSDRYPQAWSFGSALALQFHPEISPEGVGRLLDVEGSKIAATGTDVAAVRAEAAAGADRTVMATEALIGTWLDHSLRARAASN